MTTTVASVEEQMRTLMRGVDFGDPHVTNRNLLQRLMEDRTDSAESRFSRKPERGHRRFSTPNHRMQLTGPAFWFYVG